MPSLQGRWQGENHTREKGDAKRVFFLIIINIINDLFL